MKSLISKRIVSAGAIATLALLAACGDDSSSSATPDDQNSSSSEEISSSSAKESSSKDKSSSSVAKSSDSKIESSSESAESSESKEMISCYMYIVDADDADDIEESCMETPIDNPKADSLKIMCKELKSMFKETAASKAELGKGCPAQKPKPLYSCNTEDYLGDNKNVPENVTYHYYTLDSDRSKLVVKGDKLSTCENLIDFENTEYEEEETEIVSCYIYFTDSETSEAEEFCVESVTSDTYAESIESLCDDAKEALSEEDDAKVIFGKGCHEIKSEPLYSCFAGEYVSEGGNDEEHVLVYNYYTLNSEKANLVVEGDKDATCANLLESELSDDEEEEEASLPEQDPNGSEGEE